MSPVLVQSPVRKSSFFNSGAGVGMPICALAETVASNKSNPEQVADEIRFILICPSPKFDRYLLAIFSAWRY
jgi:hypothetical protein